LRLIIEDITKINFDRSQDNYFLSNFRKYIGEKAWQNLIKKAAEALTTNGKMLVDYEWDKSKCTKEADTMKVDELNLKKIYIPRASSTSWNHFDARTDRILVYTKLH